MGYHDTEYPNLLNLFANAGEALAWNNERLRQRLREGQGLPLYRAEQVDALYEHLEDEPMIRLEYDRFLPEFSKNHAPPLSPGRPKL